MHISLRSWLQFTDNGECLNNIHNHTVSKKINIHALTLNRRLQIIVNVYLARKCPLLWLYPLNILPKLNAPNKK